MSMSGKAINHINGMDAYLIFLPRHTAHPLEGFPLYTILTAMELVQQLRTLKSRTGMLVFATVV